VKRVPQLDEYGCGLACVAMVAGRTYSHIRESLEYGGVGATQLRELRKIMADHGVSCGRRLIPFRTRNPTDLRFDALLKVNPRLRGREWHWVIWDHRRQRVLDPKKKPYKRLKFVSYVRIRSSAPARCGP
jgi:hypothetical protein